MINNAIKTLVGLLITNLTVVKVIKSFLFIVICVHAKYKNTLITFTIY